MMKWLAIVAIVAIVYWRHGAASTVYVNNHDDDDVITGRPIASHDSSPRQKGDDGAGAHDDANSADEDAYRRVNMYRHVSDGTGNGQWIIGGSRRRASTPPSTERKKFQAHHDRRHQDEAEQHEWSATSHQAGGPDAASSLSEVVAVPSPHRNAIELHGQQEDVAQLWHSKRLAYITKTSPSTAAPPQPSPSGNAVLLAEVLGQKSGLNGTTKGYYGVTAAAGGSKGFQNDLMDMLGKSTWSARARFFYRAVANSLTNVMMDFSCCFKIKTVSRYGYSDFYTGRD